jgi:hypothetical protein
MPTPQSCCSPLTRRRRQSRTRASAPSNGASGVLAARFPDALAAGILAGVGEITNAADRRSREGALAQVLELEPQEEARGAPTAARSN